MLEQISYRYVGESARGKRVKPAALKNEIAGSLSGRKFN
jgi:hypothetical protein